MSLPTVDGQEVGVALEVHKHGGVRDEDAAGRRAHGRERGGDLPPSRDLPGHVLPVQTPLPGGRRQGRISPDGPSPRRHTSIRKSSSLSAGCGGAPSPVGCPARQRAGADGQRASCTSRSTGPCAQRLAPRSRRLAPRRSSASSGRCPTTFGLACRLGCHPACGFTISAMPPSARCCSVPACIPGSPQRRSGTLARRSQCRSISTWLMGWAPGRRCDSRRPARADAQVGSSVATAGD